MQAFDVVNTFKYEALLFSKILKFFSSTEHDYILSADTICAGARITTSEKSRFKKVMAHLSEKNLVVKEDSGWRAIRTSQRYQNSAMLLEGAFYADKLREKEKHIQLALTLPLKPSELQKHLPNKGFLLANMSDTDTCFQSIALSAKSEFTIMTPFLDKVGVLWVKELFELTAEKDIKRTLVIRDYEKCKQQLRQIREAIERLDIKIIDYLIEYQDAEAKRNQSYETFHAKIVLADDTVAYIGSANMLESSQIRSLEAGVVIKDHSAVYLKELIDSVKFVSEEI